MRADLRNLVVRSEEWQMLFTALKCKAMHLGYNNPTVIMLWTSLSCK